MHTAQTLNAAMFAIEMRGLPANRDDLIKLPAYGRLGVVANSPLGALGASLLLQLGITAYYDVADRQRRDRYPQYPEVYVFHVGRRTGDYSLLDIWPARREIDVPDSGPELLAAINNVAITHLLLPDGPKFKPTHFFKEPNVAFDRIESCFVYDPSGRTANADIRISTDSPAALQDIASIVDPGDALIHYRDHYPLPVDPVERADHINWLTRLGARLAELTDEDRALARRRRAALTKGGVTSETYRQIDLEEALDRLGP